MYSIHINVNKYVIYFYFDSHVPLIWRLKDFYSCTTRMGEFHFYHSNVLTQYLYFYFV